jgi:type VI secretion system protein ImpK
MREEMANLVYPVVTYGLRLRDRLERGEDPDLDNEQAVLKARLGSENQFRGLEEFAGDSSGLSSGTITGRPGKGGGQSFLGIRYALACWLDELFVVDSPWGPRWNERKLEEMLYRSNDRAWKFWEQEKLAEVRSGTDALEVCYLCVMLGFRGNLRDKPDELQRRCNAMRTRIVQGQPAEWKGPAEGQPPRDAPPLRGREQFRRMLLLHAAALAVLIPTLTALLFFYSP